MLMKDCYVGMMVIATPEANTEYRVTVEGVIGVIDDIDDYELDDDDDDAIDTIHIRSAGVQTSEEVIDLIIRTKPSYTIPYNITDVFLARVIGYPQNILSHTMKSLKSRSACQTILCRGSNL